MQRFMTFVNGSNLFTAFKHLELYVDDYEELYNHIFEQAVEWWQSTVVAATPPPAQHVRVVWHVVHDLDEWDLANPKTRQHLLDRFMDDREVRTRWLAEVRRNGGSADQAKLDQMAFSLCLEEGRSWYEKRQQVLNGMNRFHHAVEASTNFVDLCRCGRWKVDILRKTITERGLDVCFAVDAIALIDHYDVAILIGGDPDGVASVDFLKNRGKQVAVVEMLKGEATEVPERGFANPLKVSADYVVPIYERELIKRQVASKAQGGETFELRPTGT